MAEKAEILRLISEARAGDEDAFSEISCRYEPLIESLLYRYLEGGGYSIEDFRQEAEIALYQAVLSYDMTQSGVTFGLYAGVCLKNRIISLLREESRAGREKRVSLSELRGENCIDTAAERDPAENVISAESCRLLLSRIRRELTPYESLVLSLYLGGCNASEIAERTGRNKKSAENAICRIRGKIRKIEY